VLSFFGRAWRGLDVDVDADEGITTAFPRLRRHPASPHGWDCLGWLCFVFVLFVARGGRAGMQPKYARACRMRSYVGNTGFSFLIGSEIQIWKLAPCLYVCEQWTVSYPYLWFLASEPQHLVSPFASRSQKLKGEDSRLLTARS
jgi:hypothetical protein